MGGSRYDHTPNIPSLDEQERAGELADFFCRYGIMTLHVSWIAVVPLTTISGVPTIPR